ncbi:hypothetical protein GMMP1_1230006 [Candidatus Magnetomoraceae bacterium gMMP-1]
MYDQTIRLTVGGDVQAKNGTYLKRSADDLLLKACLESKFSYVLSCRQIGKSSLKNAIAEELQNKGIRVSRIDLSTIGQDIEKPEIWYFSLLDQLVDNLKIEVDFEKWWKSQPENSSLISKFLKFFRAVVLKKINDPIIIFIDEIDLTLGLSFTDDFFAAIRSIHNDRSQYPDYKRLAFVLLGVATPDDLINDNNRTPFNIGQAINIHDFTQTECEPLHLAIKVEHPEKNKTYFQQIYDWTSGHPYLTQKLIAEVAKIPATEDQNLIDSLVEKIFLHKKTSEHNIQFIHKRFLGDTHKTKMLRIYRRILFGKPVNDDERSLPITRLKLYGLIIAVDGKLVIRNRIYRKVFNVDWIKENMSIKFIVDTRLSPNSPSYIKRNTDDELLNAVLAGEFCYVRGHSQMGKSSLIQYIAQNLQEKKVRTAIVDLVRIGVLTESKHWYLKLFNTIADELKLQIQINEWWDKKTASNETNYFLTFFNDIILKETNEKIVIFIDEIDKLLEAEYKKSVFKAIYTIYNARISKPEFKRLAFVILGAVSFRDGFFKVIKLNNFSRSEATIFETALEEIYPDQGTLIFERIYSFTGGHPYLTQRLCQAIVNKEDVQNWTHEQIDQVVKKIFLSKKASLKHKVIIQEQMKLTNIRMSRQANAPEYGNDIVLLAGFGVSKFLGLPNVRHLLKASMEYLQKDLEGRKEKNPIYSVVENTYKEIGGKQGQSTFADFEKLITKLKSYIDIATILRKDPVINKELCDQLYSLNTKGFERKLKLALNECYRVLFKEFGLDMINTNSQEFSKALELFEKLSKLNFDTLHIYTTSHDCSYQAFANHCPSMAFLTHIDKSKNRYSDNWYFCMPEKITTGLPWIYVHRLHGCVAWFTDEDNQIMEQCNFHKINDKMLRKMCISNISSQERETNKGFSSAFKELQEHLLSAKALVVWGYSFKDLEVLRAINNSLNNREKPFSIYYINPYLEEARVNKNIENCLKSAPVRLSKHFKPKQIELKPQSFISSLVNVTINVLKKEVLDEKK